jgi:hypothetical protein
MVSDFGFSTTAVDTMQFTIQSTIRHEVSTAVDEVGAGAGAGSAAAAGAGAGAWSSPERLQSRSQVPEYHQSGMQ